MTGKGKATVLVGAQWGDEGKGRITDMLAEQADVVARFSGGPNAGHTVIVGEERYELHLIPSGILHSEKKNLIGNGVVIHLASLVTELNGLEKRGLSLDNLFISENAHVIMPYHLLLDRLQEERKGKGSIGTTLKGIGPAYTDKAARRGIRMCDLLVESVLEQKISEALANINPLLSAVFVGTRLLNTGEIINELRPHIERLKPRLADTSLMLDQARRAGQSILFEGAQGTLLDIDHGTYPYVTSSNPIAGAVCTGCGFGPTHIDEVIGIVKAYTTRVGGGPFPTEMDNEIGDRLQSQGHEFGVTTGRARRCGWFDAAILRLAVRINGLTQIALTKLDVLSGFEHIKLCTHYKIGEEILHDFPINPVLQAKIEPVYEELEGWQEDISGIRAYDELPQATRAYIERIEELAQTPISIVSVGPVREQAILR